jgi:hypothetical protein
MGGKGKSGHMDKALDRSREDEGNYQERRRRSRIRQAGGAAADA